MAVLTRAGNVGTQHLGSIWSGEEQLFWTQAKPGDKIMVGFESPEAGRKQVLARFTKAADYAKVQIYINGQKAGDPIDLYNHGVTPTNEMDLGAFELKKGQNTLAIEITGANNKAEKKYLVGLDYILLK